MGWLTKRPSIDWATDPIPPNGDWVKHAAPYPSSIDVVDEAVAMSKVAPAQIDRVEALVGVWRIIVAVGKLNLQTNPEAVRGLETVASRGDLSDELLWNYFTHHGALGAAARNQMIESTFDSGQAVETLAKMMREGGFHVGIAGSDRI